MNIFSNSYILSAFESRVGSWFSGMRMSFPGVLAVLGLLIAAGSIAVPSAYSQDEGGGDIGTLYNKSVQEMNAQNWEGALTVTDKIIADFGEFPYEDYGAMFGGIHYNRGICLVRLQQFEEAAEAFRICHEEFPNEKPEGMKTAPDSINPYEKTAVFQWALCLQLSQQYAEAIKLYEKFLELNPPREELQPGAYFINLGICQANVGHLEDATVSIERVFDNQAAYGVPVSSLLQGFVQLGGAWVRIAETNPAAIDTANAFMDKYMSRLRMDPFDMLRFNPLVINLAQEAYESKQYSLAVRFYSLFASTGDAISDLYLRSIDYGGVTSKLQEEIDRLQKEIDGGDPIDATVLRGLAAAYDGLGDYRASYIIHQYLEEHFVNSKYRAEILFQATRAAAGVGDTPGTLEFGSEFLEKHADHKLFSDISNLLVGALFEKREYERCVSLSLEVRDALEDGSAARDLIDFVLGTSYYYLADFENAKIILEEHFTKYPESQYAVNSQYFRASNLQKLGSYAEAGELLDAYIEKFPVSPLLDVAIFERAMCEYILQQEDFDLALSLLDRLEKEFPQSTVLGNGLLVKGDIYKTLEDLPEAESTYLRARDAAQASGNFDVAGEALSKLVETCVSLEKWEEAAKYYDEFFGDENYADGYYKVQVGVVGLEALRHLDRVEDGLGALEKLIVGLSNNPDGAEDMERAVNSYTSISAEDLGVDATIEKLTNFPGIDEATKSLRAWLLISKIGLLQEQLKKMKTDAPEYAAKAVDEKTAFDELKNFDKADLGNYILYQLGRYIVNTGNRFEAVPFYEEIMNREHKEFEDYALLELAKIWARDKDSQKKAMDAFKRIIEVFKTPELLEGAYIGMGDVAIAKEDWNTGLDIFQKYQQNKSFKIQRPKANFMIARCYEGQGDVTRAQKAYVGTFAVYISNVEWSVQSYLRNANLEWDKGSEEAKRNAYEMLRDIETRFGHIHNTPDDAGGWVDKAIRRLNEFRDALGITAESERLADEAKARGEVPASP